MYQLFWMQHLQGSKQPQRNAHGLGQWHGPAFYPGGQRLTFKQFHSDEVLAFMLTHLVNGADVGMI